MRNQYNIANHTILPLVYKIIGPHTHITYLLKQPITKSLFMFNPLADVRGNPTDSQHMHTHTNRIESRYYPWLIQHVRNIEILSQSKLTHILTNHTRLDRQYQKFINMLTMSEQKQNRRQITYIKPNPKNKNIIKPEVIGEISVCYIDAEGYTPDYNLIGVTHISPTSTKVPVLFVDNLIGVCRVDYSTGGVSDVDYIRSLDKVKYFPNQTYIFPSHIALYDDLLFSKAIIDSDTSSIRPSALLNQRIALFQKNYRNTSEGLIPTTVVQQKFMNPFFNPQKYSKLLKLEGRDKAKCFNLLRAMRRQWKSQS